MIMQMIGKLGEDKKTNWPSHLAEIVHAYCDTQGNLGDPRPFTARKYSRYKYFRQYHMEYSSI